MNNGSGQMLVRKINTALVFEKLRTQGPLSRAQLAGLLSLTRATASSIVRDLVDVGLVRETELQVPKSGRPGMLLEINPAGGCAVGLEINVDYISVVLTDCLANILWKKRISSDPSKPRATVLNRAGALVNQALKQGRDQGLRLLGIGVGLPGMVDTDHGILAYAPNLDWRDLPLRKMWTKRFSLPVFIENEANAAAMGEYYFGAGQGASNLLYLSTGVGLGGSIVIDGKVMRGMNGFAGEVGHMQIDSRGELCGCGKRGCWETTAGPLAVVSYVRTKIDAGQKSIVSEMMKGNHKKTDFSTILQAAEKKDRLALKAFEHVGAKLGVGMASLINVLNPQMIVIGGVLSQAADHILPAARKTAELESMDHVNKDLQVKSSAHGMDACTLGAATLVLDAIHREPMLAAGL